MQTDDPFERAPDLVSNIRILREAAEREMNKFTNVADYDVRRVVGQKPKAQRKEGAAPPSTPANGRAKRKPARPSSNQAVIEFSPAPVQSGNQEEVEE
jgi:hypothetical protein